MPSPKGVLVSALLSPFAQLIALCPKCSPKSPWVELAPEVEALQSALWIANSTPSSLVKTAKGIENVSQPIPSNFQPAEAL